MLNIIEKKMKWNDSILTSTVNFGRLKCRGQLCFTFHAIAGQLPVYTCIANSMSVFKEWLQ